MHYQFLKWFESILCFLLVGCVNFFQLNLQGGASTQLHMVESSMNTPVRNGQTFTSNLVWDCFKKTFFNVLLSKCVWHNILASFSQMSKQFDVDGLKDCDQLVLDRLQQSSSMWVEHLNSLLHAASFSLKSHVVCGCLSLS